MNILVTCASGTGERSMNPHVLKDGYVKIAEHLINDVIPLVKQTKAEGEPVYVLWHEPGGRDAGGNMLLHQIQDLAKLYPMLANEFGMAVEMVARFARNVIYLGYGTPDNGKFDRGYYKWAMQSVPDGIVCIDSLGVQPVDHPDAEFVRQITRDGSKHREIWVEGGPLSQWSDFNCVLDAGDGGLWDFANKKARGKWFMQNSREHFTPRIRDCRTLDRVGIKAFVQQDKIDEQAIAEWKAN